LVALWEIMSGGRKDGGMCPWDKKYRLTRHEVVQILEDFIEGSKGSPFSWDGFTLGMSFEDDYLDGIRRRCANLSEEFPPTGREYCNEQGIEVIRAYIRELRNSK
jgi:hypothetical protein